MNYKDAVESVKKAAEHPCLTDAAVRLFLILKFFHQFGPVSMAELQQETGHGRDKLRDAIELLEQHGFIKRKQNIELGRFGHYTYKTLK